MLHPWLSACGPAVPLNQASHDSLLTEHALLLLRARQRLSHAPAFAMRCVSRFGPCTGVTRLQRWERAAKLGLDPPAEVPELVRRYGEGSDFNRNLFAPGKL